MIGVSAGALELGPPAVPAPGAVEHRLDRRGQRLGDGPRPRHPAPAAVGTGNGGLRDMGAAADVLGHHRLAVAGRCRGGDGGHQVDRRAGVGGRRAGRGHDHRQRPRLLRHARHGLRRGPGPGRPRPAAAPVQHAAGAGRRPAVRAGALCHPGRGRADDRGRGVVSRRPAAGGRVPRGGRLPPHRGRWRHVGGCIGRRRPAGGGSRQPGRHRRRPVGGDRGAVPPPAPIAIAPAVVRRDSGSRALRADGRPAPAAGCHPPHHGPAHRGRRPRPQRGDARGDRDPGPERFRGRPLGQLLFRGSDVVLAARSE